MMYLVVSKTASNNNFYMILCSLRLALTKQAERTVF